MNGLDAAREILAHTASKVLMLTTFDIDDYVYTALRAGAGGFLLKDAPAEELHARGAGDRRRGGAARARRSPGG